MALGTAAQPPESKGLSPVAEDHPFCFGRRDGQLERSVEVVLLLVGPVHYLPASDDQEPRVPQVGRVQAMTRPIQDHDASRAAPWKKGRLGISAF